MRPTIFYTLAALTAAAIVAAQDPMRAPRLSPRITKVDLSEFTFGERKHIANRYREYREDEKTNIQNNFPEPGPAREQAIEEANDRLEKVLEGIIEEQREAGKDSNWGRRRRQQVAAAREVQRKQLDAAKREMQRKQSDAAKRDQEEGEGQIGDWRGEEGAEGQAGWVDKQDFDLDQPWAAPSLSNFAVGGAAAAGAIGALRTGASILKQAFR